MQLLILHPTPVQYLCSEVLPKVEGLPLKDANYCIISKVASLLLDDEVEKTSKPREQKYPS